MARYHTTVESTRPLEEVFDYLAEFSNARRWDPGVVEGQNVTGMPLGEGTRFRLVSRFLGRRIPLEYRIIGFERPNRVVFQADQSVLRSTDEIRLTATPDGTSVTYDADLRLKGPVGRLMDPMLALSFRRIGDRAAAGLRAALNP